MDLRIGRATTSDTSRCGVAKLRGEHIMRGGEHPAARAFTYHRDLTTKMLKRS
jgi:hypothetical protein